MPLSTISPEAAPDQAGPAEAQAKSLVQQHGLTGIPPATLELLRWVDAHAIPVTVIRNQPRPESKSSFGASASSRTAARSRVAPVDTKTGFPGIPLTSESGSLLTRSSTGHPIGVVRAHESIAVDLLAASTDGQSIETPPGDYGENHGVPSNAHFFLSAHQGVKLDGVTVTLDEGLFYGPDGDNLIYTDASDPSLGIGVDPVDLLQGLRGAGIPVRVTSITTPSLSKTILAQVTQVFRRIFIAGGDSPEAARYFMGLLEQHFVRRLRNTLVPGKPSKMLLSELREELAPAVDPTHEKVASDAKDVLSIPPHPLPEESAEGNDTWVELPTLVRLLPQIDRTQPDAQLGNNAVIGKSMRMQDPEVRRDIFRRQRQDIRGQVIAALTSHSDAFRDLQTLREMPDEVVLQEIKELFRRIQEATKKVLWLVPGHTRGGYGDAEQVFQSEVVRINTMLEGGLDPRFEEGQVRLQKTPDTAHITGSVEHISIVDSSIRALENRIRVNAPRKKIFDGKAPTNPDPIHVSVLIFGSSHVYDPNNAYVGRIEALKRTLAKDNIIMDCRIPSTEEMGKFDEIMSSSKTNNPRQALSELSGYVLDMYGYQVDMICNLSTDLSIIDVENSNALRKINKDRAHGLVPDAADTAPMHKRKRIKTSGGKMDLVWIDGLHAYAQDAIDRLFGDLHQEEIGATPENLAHAL